MAEALVPIAVVILVIFFFIPNRHLGPGRWAIALVAFCFMFAVTSAHPLRDWEVWVSAVAAVVCIALWVRRKQVAQTSNAQHHEELAERQ